jgi:hypothetical protein
MPAHSLPNSLSKSAPREDLEPWDPRPWPKRGDDSIETLYAAAGRALSQWERYENTLSLLFSALVATALTPAARRAYHAMRTFEDRVCMLRAAAEGYFAEKPDPDLLTELKEILQSAANFAPRRHDIAHGVVDRYMPYPPGSTSPEDATYCLYPSGGCSSERDRDNLPAYCLTSAELDYFFSEFYRLQEPAASVTMRILKRDQPQISRATPRRDLHS